jgi:hypothetical protein
MNLPPTACSTRCIKSCARALTKMNVCRDITWFLVPATGRYICAARASRRHAGRSARGRTRPPWMPEHHRGWPCRQGRCQCVPGHQRRRSPPVRSPRAARLRSTRAGRGPDRRAGGNLASEAIVIPTGPQEVAGRADTYRRPGRDHREAGGSGRGLALACPRAVARSLVPRDPRIRPRQDGTSRPGRK